MNGRLPDPRLHPLLSADELLGVLPLKRSALYEAIRRGELPTIRYGRRLYVINAELQRQLGLTPEMQAAEPASSAAVTSPAHRQEDKVVCLHDGTSPAA